MICDICRRPHDEHKRPFLCVVDVRNKLYEGRIAHTRLLLENEQLENKISALQADASDLSSDASDSSQDRKARILACLSEHEELLESTAEIEARAASLREEVAANRQRIDKTKSSVSGRKADLASASDGIVDRRERQQEETQRSIKTFGQRWDRSHQKLATTRSFLSMESAKLYGLRRVKKGSLARYEYQLGGIEIVGLQGLNGASLRFPDLHLSLPASVDGIARC